MRLKDPQPRNPKVQKRLEDAVGPGGETARWLADLVRSTVKDCMEDLYHTMPTWAVKEGPFFVHIEAYAKHANLGFCRGTSLEDPDKLLEGSGKVYRFVRVAGPGAVPKPKLIRLVKQAQLIAKQEK